AYVFTRQSNVWLPVQVLSPSDATPGQRFGAAVASTNDAIIIGAPQDGELGNWAGAVYVFHLNGGSWEQVQKLTPSDLASDSYFGTAVTISGDVLVGSAPY